MDTYEIKPRPSIDELERILDGSAGDFEIHILPNGEVKSVHKGKEECVGVDAILTSRNPLGTFY